LSLATHYLLSFSGCDNGNRFELHKVAPFRGPFGEYGGIVPFHYLVAAAKRRFDPTRNIVQSVRHHPAVISKSLVNFRPRAVVKMFDDHVEHNYFFGCQGSIL